MIVHGGAWPYAQGWSGPLVDGTAEPLTQCVVDANMHPALQMPRKTEDSQPNAALHEAPSGVIGLSSEFANQAGDRPASFAGLAGLSPSDPMDSARLMGVITALAAEVYVLKAEVMRLTIALDAAGVAGEAALAEAGRSERMKAWFNAEEGAFGRALLRPFTHPDEVPDVSSRMVGER